MRGTLEQAIINVGVNRRITLPQFIKVDEGQQLLVRENEEGSFELTVYTNAPKKKIYAVVIGKETPERLANATELAKQYKWYGIFVDENGIVLARQKATTLEYLKKDLSCPDKRGRDKLDNQCGRGLWEFPVILSYQDVENSKNVELLRTVLHIKNAFVRGEWPPLDTRVSA